MTMLVLLEHDRGAMAEASREALTAARPLGDQLGEDLQAVLIGSDDESLLAEATSYGADTVHVVEAEGLIDYGPDAWASVLCQLADGLEANVLIAVGSDRGNEVLAQVAARLDRPFVANCTTIETGGSADGDWELTRVQWGGSLLEDVSVAGDDELRIASFGLHAVASEPAANPGDVTVETHELTIDDVDLVTLVRDRVVLSQGVTLSTAPVVIGGGRGVGSADAFGPLEELAELLSGRVGCSRAVTNNGWRPHSDQVGQTGTRIAPELYIASGISGAIQHWVGAMASKRILAINTDAEANMVTKADYAVIGDLHKVIPAISEEIRRRGSAVS